MVPVVDSQQRPLMPTSPKRARQMIERREATPFFKMGLFCIRLNKEPSARNLQPVAVGIDPGSKKEGFTVKSEAHTILNVQADAVTWVKSAVESRRNARKARRGRKTPCRQPRSNRTRGSKGRIPPSTRARWGWKLRLVALLRKLFPVTDVVVEDIAAMTKKGQRKWNKSFSPLEVGKAWFYGELRKIATLTLKQGWETKNLRDLLGLKKSKAKMSEVFSAHCVDSWVLAREAVGGHQLPEHEKMICVTPLQFHRRQLHRFQPAKGGKRSPYGGTRSLGLKRGSLVSHPRHGTVYLGGSLEGRFSLHEIATGKRLTQTAKPQDCTFLAFNSLRWHHPKKARTKKPAAKPQKTETEKPMAEPKKTKTRTKTGLRPSLKEGVSAPKTR